MTSKEAKQTAAARGFTSVAHWMRENRKARRAFNSRKGVKGEDRARLERLIRALDDEYTRISTLQ